MYKLTSIALLCVLTIGLLAADTPAPVVQSEAGKKALTRIRQLGGLALELAQNDQHLEVSYLQIDGKWTDEHLTLLKDLKGVVHLNLRGQPVTDAQLAYLKPLTELTHLHLEKTKITDKGLVNLKGLSNLEYLNLYDTAVSDGGLADLEGLKKLKKLYVWNTKVSEAGGAKLKKAIASLDINRGIEEKAETKKEEKKVVVKKDDKKDKKAEAKKDAKKPEPKKEEKKAEAKKEEKKDKKPEPAKGATTADEMTVILKARVALAEKAYREAFAEKPEDVYRWSVRWLQAQRDVSPKHEDHVAALEAHLKRMTELQKQVKMLSKSRTKENDAEWYRLEAQLWLAKAKVKQVTAK